VDTPTGRDNAGIPDGRTVSIPPAPRDEELKRLRELLFAREIALLDSIKASLDNPRTSVDHVSSVLAEAIHLRAGKDPALSMALEPVVDSIVKTSLHSRKNEFVNALFPLMGPTIRKSIAESFRSMLGSFSKSMEMAFSWKGLRWRFEAMRSGKSFSEIVMLNTLVYRVEQVFFIHSGTGLVLSHVVDDSVNAQDADMVSAMLTAIQDFVKDCFTGGQDEELQSLQMGEFTVYIEKDSRAYIACVVRGVPPANFREHLRATLELMLVEFDDVLEGFNGDTALFEGAPRYLNSCLFSHYNDDDQKKTLLGKAVLALSFAGLLAGAGYLYAEHDRSLREQARVAAEQEAFTASMRGALEFLHAEPGLLVTNVGETPQAPWEVLVLKDALARSPEDVFREKNVNSGLFAIKEVPFISYDPAIVVRRIKNSIQPPGTVDMVFDAKGVLTFSGTAPMSWIVATREDARSIPGVEHVDVSGVRDPMMERISAMIDEVENTVIEFPLGKDIPVPSELAKLETAVDSLVALEVITKSMGFSTTLTIYGHADMIGNARRNYELSQSRARTVAALLYAKGSSMPVALYGMGSEYPRGGTNEAPVGKTGNQASRRIELRVSFTLSPRAKLEMFLR